MKEMMINATQSDKEATHLHLLKSIGGGGFCRLFY